MLTVEDQEGHFRKKNVLTVEISTLRIIRVVEDRIKCVVKRPVNKVSTFGLGSRGRVPGYVDVVKMWRS